MLAEAQAANTEALDSDDPRGWFARYPRFLSSSRTDVRGRRMAYRHRALIERHASILDGARVLDLASHDGRWSFAALQAGAIATGFPFAFLLLLMMVATWMALRNERRDANKKGDQAAQAHDITEDFHRELKDAIQASLKRFESRVDEIVAKKTDEIMND